MNDDGDVTSTQVGLPLFGIGAILLAMVSMAAGCPADRQLHGQIRAAGSQVDERIRQVELARVAAASERLQGGEATSGPHLAPSLRVVLEPGEVTLDASAWLLAVAAIQPKRGGAALTEALEDVMTGGERLPALSTRVSWVDGAPEQGRRALIEAAVELSRIERAVRLASERAGFDLESGEPLGLVLPDPTASGPRVYVGRDTPYGQVTDVLYALGQAEHARFVFPVVAAGAEATLVVGTPRFRRPEAACLGITLTATASGVFVTLNPGSGGVVDGVGSAATGPEGAPSWQGRSVRGEDGACPPVAADPSTGAIRPEVLGDLVASLATRGPLCETAVVKAAPGVTWRHVAKTLAAVELTAPFEPFLAMDGSFDAATALASAHARCKGGIAIEDVDFEAPAEPEGAPPGVGDGPPIEGILRGLE